MRGSTAGLQPAAGGARLRPALLGAADALFASLLITPAVVAYWKSTWTLMDLYVLPERPVHSAAYCAAFGTLCGFVFCVFQTPLARLTPPGGRTKYYVLSRLYTCVASVACIAAFRGTWNLLNEFAGLSARSLLLTTGAASLSLAGLRALRNVCAAPFAIAIDAPHDYFAVPTMFRVNTRDTWLYVLDCVFSVAVVGTLVAFVWRGSWAIFDVYLLPDNKTRSYWTSMVAGYIVVALTFGSQAPMSWAAARLDGTPRLLLADLYHFVSFLATVNVWRGIWGILDEYLYPENPKLSNWLTHGISMIALILLNCSNSILVRGVYIDAEEPGGECVVFPCHYIRYYYHRDKTKENQEEKRQEDASLAPLQATVADEKERTDEKV